MSLNNYLDKLRIYFWFSKDELKSFIWTSLVLGFVASFDWWGDVAFDWRSGLLGFAGGILLVASALFVHHAAQRLAGIGMGFRVEQQLWWYGIIGSLLLVFVTNGRIQFFAASATTIHFLSKHRLGKFRYGINLYELAKVCAVGPLANILFGGLVISFSWLGLFPEALAIKIFTFNLIFAGWNLLPIPPLDGSKIMFYSRLTYAFLFGTVAGYIFLVYMFNYYSYIVALLCGIASWLFALIVVEKNF